MSGAGRTGGEPGARRGRVLVDIGPLRRYPAFRRLWLGQLVSRGLLPAFRRYAGSGDSA